MENTVNTGISSDSQLLVIDGCQVKLNYADVSQDSALSEVKRILFSCYDSNTPSDN